MKWTYFLVVTLVVLSCKKEKESVNSLIGKWKNIEIYQGYAMGGCMCWQPVEPRDAQTLNFFPTGKYTLTQPEHFSVPACSGNYRVVDDSTLAMTYECQSDPSLEVNHSFTRNGNILTITYQGFEGAIIYKYMKKF